MNSFRRDMHALNQHEHVYYREVEKITGIGRDFFLKFYRDHSVAVSLGYRPRSVQKRDSHYYQKIQKWPHDFSPKKIQKYKIIQKRPQTLQKDLKNEDKGLFVIVGVFFVSFCIFVFF